MRNLLAADCRGHGPLGPAATAALAAGGEALPPSGTDIRDVEFRCGAVRTTHGIICRGCHSLKYLRYNRMAGTCRFPRRSSRPGLMFTSEKPFDTVISALPGADAEAWFGKQPPDCR